MKGKIILLLVFLTTDITSKAQPFYGWTADATTITENNFEIKATATTVDFLGNVYTTGYFIGTVDFDPGAGTANLSSNGSNYDAFISKMDANGNYIWAKSMGGNDNNGDYGLGIAVDGAGNVYTTGEFWGTVDFDPGAGISNLSSAGNNDIFVQNLDAAGNFLWAKSFGNNLEEGVNSIAVDNIGNIYTTGYFVGTVDFDPGSNTVNLTSAGAQDVYILKWDALGNYIWVKSISGINFSGENAYAITVDGIGNVYTTGEFQQDVDFDPGVGTAFLSSVGNQDIFIQKLDVNGNYVWAKRMGGITSDYPYTIAVDGNGNVHTAGIFGDVADFDPGAGVANLTSAGSFDIFISKLDAAGNFVWAKSIGSSSPDNVYSLAVDGSGNIYATGNFEDVLDFDPGAGTANLTPVGELDIFILKLDVLGNYIWAKRMGADSRDEASSVALDGNGNIYTAGLFRNTANMNPVGGTDNKVANNVGIFTQKLSQCNTFSLANHLDNETITTRNVGGYYLEFQQSCRVLARYMPAGGNTTAQGNITTRVWVESTQPGTVGNQFVKRHYEITPANNASTATGKVTLYFTQSEFDDFNAVSALDLPANSSDGIGKANLLIEKRGGVSSDGSGLPNTYTGTVSTINPNDADIIWNSVLNRWEVSFEVTGFSGFFVKTQATVLPVRWLSISGKLTAANRARVNWQVQESNVENYILEKTTNNAQWITIANIKSKGDGINSYSFTEATPLQDITYYRVRQVDKDNRESYSLIIKISASSTAFTISVFPNPSKNIVNVRNARIGSTIVVTDLSGRILKQSVVRQNDFSINIYHFAKGVYLFKIGSEVVQKIIKE
jgi:hypothetical protein